MILCFLIANKAGNGLLERFHAVAAEERSQWRSFLVKLGMDNLKFARDEEELVASHRSVFIVYTGIGDLNLFAVGNEEYDELGLSEVLHAVISSLKDICKKAPTEVTLLNNYGKVCLSLDEIISQGILEHTDKDRVRRLAKLKPQSEVQTAAPVAATFAG